ncbi:MAG: hypothetical protein RLY87_1471 [Chloroflexota bacterium]|jgi:uncharacterized damage-inducible protein DinB
MTDIVTRAIESLRAFPTELESLIGNIACAQVRVRPSPDAWSIIEIAGHLTDAERVMRERITQICTNDAPIIIPFDQDASVRNQRYHDADLLEVLRSLHQERQTTLALVAQLRPADFARTGWHPEVGILRVDMLLEYLAKHDYQHYRHIHVILRHIAKIAVSPVSEGTHIHA